MLVGLGLLGVAFALHSAVHSYMVLAYCEAGQASLRNVLTTSSVRSLSWSVAATCRHSNRQKLFSHFSISLGMVRFGPWRAEQPAGTQCGILSGRTIFDRLMDYVSRFAFQSCVAKYDGAYQVPRFSCWDPYLCMAFAQFTCRGSLRDIGACLGALQTTLDHVGIHARVSRPTLADAHKTCDWRIYADVARGLIRTARDLYVDEPLAVALASTVYALDATIAKRPSS